LEQKSTDRLNMSLGFERSSTDVTKNNAVKCLNDNFKILGKALEGYIG